MSDNGSRDYEVGYKKPPKSHQFQKGQSGNPNGRPKKPKGLSEAMQRELEREITVTENGKTQHIKVEQAIAKAMVHKALKGDVPMTRLVLGLIADMKGPTPDFEALAEDTQVLSELVAQLGKSNSE